MHVREIPQAHANDMMAAEDHAPAHTSGTSHSPSSSDGVHDDSDSDSMWNAHAREVDACVQRLINGGLRTDPLKRKVKPRKVWEPEDHPAQHAPHGKNPSRSSSDPAGQHQSQHTWEGREDSPQRHAKAARLTHGSGSPLGSAGALGGHAEGRAQSHSSHGRGSGRPKYEPRSACWGTDAHLRVPRRLGPEVLSRELMHAASKGKPPPTLPIHFILEEDILNGFSTLRAALQRFPLDACTLIGEGPEAVEVSWIELDESASHVSVPPPASVLPGVQGAAQAAVQGSVQPQAATQGVQGLGQTGRDLCAGVALIDSSAGLGAACPGAAGDFDGVGDMQVSGDGMEGMDGIHSMEAAAELPHVQGALLVKYPTVKLLCQSQVFVLAVGKADVTHGSQLLMAGSVAAPPCNYSTQFTAALHAPSGILQADKTIACQGYLTCSYVGDDTILLAILPDQPAALGPPYDMCGCCQIKHTNMLPAQACHAPRLAAWLHSAQHRTCIRSCCLLLQRTPNTHLWKLLTGSTRYPFHGQRLYAYSFNAAGTRGEALQVGLACATCWLLSVPFSVRPCIHSFWMLL